MLVVKCLTLAYAASVLVLASATSLQIVGAGVRGFNGPRLISGSSLCTNDYPNGFSIVCDAPGASAAVFFVNGIQQRREGVAPYTINGDVSGNIFKWTPPAGVVTIDCNPVGAPSVSVSVKFACTPAPAPSPSPSSVPAVVTLRAVQAGTSGNDRTIKKLAPGFTLCPTDFTNGLSLVCDAPDAASVTFKVNGAVVRKESVVPFTIAGDSNGIVNAWKSFPSGAVTITCTTSTGESLTIVGSTCVPVTSAPAPVVTPKPSPSAAAVVGIDRNYCVGLKATSFVGSLSPGWTVDGESLWFRRYFDGTGIVDPDNAPLAYKFKVPVASTYGFTLDMKTAHVVDHNVRVFFSVFSQKLTCLCVLTYRIFM